ncbi:sensor histidine kinase [Piscinibacter koreensis]|uniref:histidine kinase n=1 Tax=Piscinibacter koreensis TaxID=2742824 RepID=A0A7Y6TX75_9BURK|nr:ATP-binding protein [Schlegelella koreensis]NUZ06812.1 hypothetical protein [Schlegelella koreensis]
MLRDAAARDRLRPTPLRRASLVPGAFAAAAWPLATLAAESDSATAKAAPAGSLVPLFVFVVVLGVIAVAAWAVWRWRQDAGALHQARLEQRSLVDVLDVWQWRTDAEHRVVALRPPSGAGTEAWRALATGQPLWELVQADDAGALRARLAAGAPIDDVGAERDDAGGARRRVQLRGRSLVDATGRFAGYIGTLREVDRPGAAPGAAASGPARAVAGAPAKDDRTAGDADREAFSYTVSHDLRAPIRVVEGFTKIVKEDYGRVLDRIGLDHLDRVLGAAARMNNMIDALLALSKLSSQPLADEPVNLSEMAGSIAEELRRQSPARDVAIDIEPGLAARGDPTLLRSVLENLLGNAWKYTAHTRQAQVRFARVAGEASTFYVRDNGAGFDMRFADRLFSPFQRLHSASEFPGTGVGLASVRRIVRRHGGDIRAESEPDKGATFTFSLPGSGR